MMQISFREKMVLIAGAVFLIMVFAVKGIWIPAMEKNRQLEKRVAAGRQALQEMTVLQARYRALQPGQGALAPAALRHEKGFTLFAFLDRLARQCGVKENIVHMKPGSRKSGPGQAPISMVKVKMESLHLSAFIEFLRLVETAERGVHVSGISLSRTGKEVPLLDVVLDVWTVAAPEEPS